MLPDPTAQWSAYPSIIDGIARPPYVQVRGLWQSVLYLLVTSPGDRLPAYGIRMGIEAFCGVEEMAYSIVGYGAAGAPYNGETYIKETRNSATLARYSEILNFNPTPRHFLFVGGDHCYEAIGDEPLIEAFETLEAAWAWRPEETI